MLQYKFFDSLLEPVFVIEGDGKIVYCNEAAAAACEMSVRKLNRGMIITQALRFLDTPDFFANENSLRLVVEPTPYQEIAFQALLNDQPKKAQITCQKVADLDHWIIFFRDVTLEETLQKKYRAELEQVRHYSKNLEKLVDERTFEIKELNKTMTALLDSLSQGFFIFNSEGLCLEVSSKACLETVEVNPTGKAIWEVLKIPDWELEDFKKWSSMLFQEVMAFEDLVPLGPQNYFHSLGKTIRLEFYPIRDVRKKIEAIVVVATDASKLIEAQKQAEAEKEHAKMILNLLRSKRQVGGFLRDAEDLIEKIDFAIAQREKADLQDLFRHLHTLKGGASLFSVRDIVEACHQAEESLSAVQREGFNYTSFENLTTQCRAIKVQFNKFKEENISLLGAAVHSRDRKVEAAQSQFTSFAAKIRSLNPKLASEFLQEFLTEPIGDFFEHYNGLVESLASNEGKEMGPTKIHNGELKVFSEPYEELFASCVHAFRNAVDHGIEFPDEREALGKSRAGQINIHFKKTRSQKNPSLLIMIIDDGRGINPQIIRDKLDRNSVDHKNESDRQVVQHIFDSQFSTREAITETSGRGVGMDAIQFAARELGGRAWVKTRVGFGTTLYIYIPWIVPQYSLKKIAS